MSLAEVMAEFKELAAIAQVADFGLIDQGRLGYCDYELSTGIEQWRGAFYFQVTVVLSKSAGTKTSVIKWPYSRISADDLRPVIADWEAVYQLGNGRATGDTRGWLARGFDRLLRRTHLGEYVFQSVLSEPQETTRVHATASRIGSSEEVTLIERRQSGVFNLAQFPQSACRPLISRLERGL